LLQAAVFSILFQVFALYATEEESKLHKSISNPLIVVHMPQKENMIPSSKLTALPLGELNSRLASSPRRRKTSRNSPTQSPVQTPRSESPHKSAPRLNLKLETDEVRDISPRRSPRREELPSQKETPSTFESVVSGIKNLFSVAEDENQPEVIPVELEISEICRLIHREYNKMSEIPEETLNPAFHMFRYYFFHHTQNGKQDLKDRETIKLLPEVVSGSIETWINDMLVNKNKPQTFETILNQFWRMTIWPDFVNYMSAMDDGALNLIVESMKYIGSNHKDSVMQIIFFKKIDKIYARLPHKIPNTKYWLIAAQSLYAAQDYWGCYQLMNLTNDKSKYSWIKDTYEDVQENVLTLQKEKWNLCYRVVDLFVFAGQHIDETKLPAANVTQSQKEMLRQWYKGMLTQTDDWLLDRKIKLNMFIPGSSGSRPNILELSMLQLEEWLDNLLKVKQPPLETKVNG
jgi:hypothetical protein